MENDQTNPATVQLMYERLDEIHNLLKKDRDIYPLKDRWLDINQTCQVLNISKRTCQSYRDNGVLPFSQIAGKIYFKVADIEAHLMKHYIKARK
jgi:hypothetical protein